MSAAFSAIELALSLENFLGGQTVSDVFRVELSAETLPNVQIVGGAHREIVVNRALSVEASAGATTCDSRPASESGVDYSWQLSLADGTELDIVSTGKNPKFFKLDANALDAGEVYELRVVVTDAVTGWNGVYEQACIFACFARMKTRRNLSLSLW